MEKCAEGSLWVLVKKKKDFFQIFLHFFYIFFFFSIGGESIILAGGRRSDPAVVLATVEILDPNDLIQADPPQLHVPRYGCAGLRDACVIVKPKVAPRTRRHFD